MTTIKYIWIGGVVILLLLRTINVIKLSWWLVLAPIWVPAMAWAIAFVALAVMMIVAGSHRED